MDIAAANRKVNNLSNNLEKEVGRLFLNLGFELIDCCSIIQNNTKNTIGELDFIFRFKKFLFLIEVSKEKRGVSRKADHFFSRWIDRKNLDCIFSSYSISPLKTMRIYFDVSKETPQDMSASIDHQLNNENFLNRILFKDDLEYFQDSYNKVRKLARNDLLSFLEVPIEETSKRIDAIQFYIAGIPAFAFVEKVDRLLDSCYIFRRLKNDKGYQRVLQPGRIGQISDDINSGRILAFPNSILINCQNQKLVERLFPPEDCPTRIKISLPTSYCSCRVIDGQHRLLGFANVDEEIQKAHSLPVIAFQDLDIEQEMRTFIDINSKQKKMDNNLILLLKSDFDWPENSKEFKEKMVVKVIKKLDRDAALKNKVFFGRAYDERKGKITLTTLVSAIIKNNLIGGSIHLFQEDIHDIKTPYNRINEVFSLIKLHLGDYYFDTPDHFFVGNKGLRIIFRFIQIFERNKLAGNIDISLDEAFHDISSIINPEFRYKLDDYYGEGGANKAVKEIIDLLRREKPQFSSIETDLYRLRSSK